MYGRETLEFAHPEAEALLDTLLRRFSSEREYASADSLEIDIPIAFLSVNQWVSMEDLNNLNEDELLAKYDVKGFWKRLLFRQGLRIEKSQTGFLVYILGNVLWMMLVMMPMLAFVLKLLYIRRHYLFFEHLLFSFHTHTFVFLVYAILMVFRKWVPGYLVGLSFLAAAVYLYLAMRRFYGQGWLKTFAKFILANLMYLFIFILSTILILVVSALLF